MTTRTRLGLYVALPNAELRWALRRAAADRRVDVRVLVISILNEWLRASGYRTPSSGPAQEFDR